MQTFIWCTFWVLAMRYRYKLTSCVSFITYWISVTIFDELFRSEGVKQVYGIVTEWMADLDASERRKIKWILYDDMCHLGLWFFVFFVLLNLQSYRPIQPKPSYS